MKEFWKPIDGYSGNYLISSLGRVKSVDRKVPRGNHILHIKERILALAKDKDGYEFAVLSKHGKQYIHKIHRLVAIAFIDNGGNLPLVNHKNEIKNDNRVENLEWCTSEYNLAYGTARDRMRNTQNELFGKRVCVIDKEGNVVERFSSLRDAARSKGLDSSSIRRVCHGKQKTSGGVEWKLD